MTINDAHIHVQAQARILDCNKSMSCSHMKKHMVTTKRFDLSTHTMTFLTGSTGKIDGILIPFCIQNRIIDQIFVRFSKLSNSYAHYHCSPDDARNAVVIIVGQSVHRTFVQNEQTAHTNRIGTRERKKEKPRDG